MIHIKFQWFIYDHLLKNWEKLNDHLAAIAKKKTVLSTFTSKFTLPNPGVDTAFKIIIWCVFSSVIFTGYLLYVKDLKIKDAYNLKAISDYGADIMMAVIFMIPLVLLSNAIFLGSITYIFVLFFGIPNPVWLFICAMFVFQNISVIGNYLAQIAMENIEIKLEMEKYDRGETSI